MLVDEFLGELDLDIKLSHVCIVLHIEVLSVEEGNFVGVVRNLIRLDVLFLRPVHVLSQYNWLLRRLNLGVLILTLVQVLKGSELNFDEKLRAELRLICLLIVSLVHSSEINKKGLVDKICVNLELEYAEIDDYFRTTRFLEVHVVVCLYLHASSAILFDDTELQVHGFIGCRGDFAFGLFEHDLEKTLHSWCELNHIVLVVVNREDISYVELT